ncbi:MAG: acyl-CoA dehydrogenase family protein, partial [Solirubrobacteraceae bacterium]
LGTEEARELADLFCRQSRLRVEQLFNDLWNNEDSANYKVAQQVLDGRYTWAEHNVLDPSELSLPLQHEIEEGVGGDRDLSSV